MPPLAVPLVAGGCPPRIGFLSPWRGSVGRVRIVKALVAGFLVFAGLSTLATLAFAGADEVLTFLNVLSLAFGVVVGRSVLRSA